MGKIKNPINPFDAAQAELDRVQKLRNAFGINKKKKKKGKKNA